MFVTRALILPGWIGAVGWLGGWRPERVGLSARARLLSCALFVWRGGSGHEVVVVVVREVIAIL